jgi:hypothetical protein
MIDTATGEITAGIPPMPPKVAAAVAAVMSAVPKLSKSATNTHGSYNFASIDDFLEAVRPLCAKEGLIIIQDEDGFEMREGWLVITFCFTLAHSSGETWAHRPRRTIMVSAKMGAQAFGAGQSYALKQFERSLFQIATGEKGADADEHPPAELPKGAVSADQLRTLQAAIMEVDADLPKFLKYLKIPKLEELPAARYRDAMEALEAKRQPKAAA